MVDEEVDLTVELGGGGFLELDDWVGGKEIDGGGGGGAPELAVVGVLTEFVDSGGGS